MIKQARQLDEPRRVEHKIQHLVVYPQGTTGVEVPRNALEPLR